MFFQKVFKVASVLFVIFFTSMLYAQQVYQGDQVGVQAKDIKQAEKEKQIEKKAKEKVPEKPSQILPYGVKEGGPLIKVKKIQVKGDKILAYEKILDIVLKYEGTEMTLADLYRVAIEIGKLYEKEGYLTSFAYLPEQDVTDGIILIRVIEGKVGKVKVRGNKYFRERLLTRDLEHRLVGKVLDYDILEKVIRQLNFNTDREVKSYLMPGEHERETDVLLVVDDTRPGHFTLDASRTGTDSTGNERYGLAYSNSNYLNLDDEFTVKYIYGDGFSGVSGAYLVPIYDNRTKLGFSYQYVKINVGGDYSYLDVKGSAHVAQIFVMRELYTGRGFDVDFKLGFSKKRMKNKLLGTTSGVDDLSVVNADMFFDLRDRLGRTFSNVGIDVAVSNALGSSTRADLGLNRVGSEPGFVKLRASFDRYHRISLIKRAMLHLKARCQYTQDSLVPAEHFSLGGFNNVRGYAEGEYSGDTGGIVSAELFMPFPFVPDFKIPFKDKKFKEAVQLVGFCDYGYAKLNDPRGSEEFDKEFLGAGVGVRAHLFKDFYGRFEWGFPLGDESISGNSEFHFMIQTELI